MANMYYSDVTILREFKEKVQHLVKQPISDAGKAEMAVLGKPFLTRLQANGHSLQDCADLMYPVLGLRVRQVGTGKVQKKDGTWADVRQF